MIRARRTDPATSHEAAASAEDRGQIERDRDLALRMVRERPGLTCRQLADGDEALRQRIGRRLSELAACACGHNDRGHGARALGRGACLVCWCMAFNGQAFRDGRHIDARGRSAMRWWPVRVTNG